MATSLKKLSGVAVFAALAASLCCITPLLALVAGISGAASAFSWLEPARPYLLVIAIAALGFAWYRALKADSSATCGSDNTCSVGKKSFLASKKFLAIITVASALLMSFPFYGSIFYPKGNQQAAVVSPDNVQQVVFKVSGMTCESCEEHIKHALRGAPGIVDARADYQSGVVSITYNGSKTNKSSIIKSIDATGYKAGEEITSKGTTSHKQKDHVCGPDCK